MPHTRTLKGVAVADGTANGASEDAKTSPMSSDALPRNTQNSELPAGNDKCTVHSAGNDDQGDDDDGTASLALSAQNQDGESDDQTQLPADRLTNSQISASVDSFEDALTILPTQIGTLEQPHTLVPTQTLDSQTNPILPHTQPRGSGQPESTVRNGPESIYTIDVTESVCTATARLDVAINAQSCEGEKDGEEVDSVAPATDLLQEPQMDDEIQSVDENKTNSRLRMRSRDASAVGTDAAAQTPIAETAALMAPTECVPEDLLGRKACAAVVGAGGGAGEMRQGCSKINTDRRAGSGQAVKKANTDLSDGEGQMDDGRVSSDTKQKDVHGEQTERDGEPINPSNQEGHSGTCSTLAGTGGVQTHMGDKDGDACTGSDLDLDNLSSSTREEKIDHVSNGLNDQVNQGDEATQPDAKVAVGIDVTDGQGDDILGQDEGNGVCGMQRLVVEIKNRAGGRIFNPPHLHEQVQVLVYLKLTGCTQGDLVQYVDSDRGKGESLMDISRVRLEDFENADVWESVIVPRLSEFCQIVHKVRQDDNLRTRLMMNSTLDNFEARDDLAVDLCPSMEHASSIRRPRSQSKVK
ncbi:hypothetical protein SARC_00464 [Sphaeroforma arctica JP610]|uniref:Uncharacterized protein n=1 Tax=Sphaeroforma arctica JP610 TaxID=667725 RepID=A0A0L0GEH3_9EUKA|nr:hypothetical protein SARC_00464 [Sphaeroforma arctica JP610]KNC87427.1 hypothetical protein SARC_00464 [Sphaeroforma arctica JP610]|eukprot:XP_014161329.1 hypothetical protein SARC_00464 [Sphaeroforma arctica JP610]